MYKIVIADDEIIIQEGLVQMIDWKQLGFEIVETFDDGETVIEYLNSMPVDVILTDIMMTHINGIEIARYVQENDIPCKVVFISGYKDFEYALQAIRYGVEDYILKPSKVEDVREVFQKIKAELDIKEKDVEYRRRAEKRWEEMRPVMEEKFFTSLMMGTLNDNEEIEKRIRLFYPDIDVPYAPCAVIDLEIENYEKFIQDRWNYSSEQLDDALNNFIKLYSGAGHFHIIHKYKGSMSLFVIMNCDSFAEEDKERQCNDEISQFVKQFREIFYINVSLKIEKIFACIYHVVQWRENLIKNTTRLNEKENLLQEQKKMILTNLLMGNVGTSQKIMNNILKNLSEGDIRYYKNFIVDIFSVISELLRENNQALYQLIQPYMDYHGILNMSSKMEIENYCNSIFEKMKSKESLSNQFNGSGLIDLVKNYVRDHIYEDISIETVANAVFLSKTHLSRTFKKQMGESFLQYVTRKKMEKAAELLHNPKYKVYQVGEMLGYKTPRYFSKTFQSFMGYYPGEYRKDVLNMGEMSDEE